MNRQVGEGRIDCVIHQTADIVSGQLLLRYWLHMVSGALNRVPSRISLAFCKGSLHPSLIKSWQEVTTPLDTPLQTLSV